MKVGITIKHTIGVGDALQYTSLPENYYRAKKERLVDISRPWFFDSNPFVDRVSLNADRRVEMWNFPHQYNWPTPRPSDKPKVYLSNAEIWAAVFGCVPVLNRPRLYRFEEFPFHERKKILLHTTGISHGEMPEHIVNHVIKKYGKENLFHVGYGGKIKPKDYGLQQIETRTLWDLAEVISKCRMFIGVDSGPSWIAASYPDVITKVVRTKPNGPELFKDWIPLEINNIHSMWDSRERMTYNVSQDDVGFTQSYLRI